jgi:hypothetical protein
MTADAVAARFGVPQETVLGWIDQGLLAAEWRPARGRGRGRYWSRRADVLAFGERYYADKPRPAWLDEPEG